MLLASAGPAISFNGQARKRNLFQATIPREGAAIVTLAAPESQAQDPLKGTVQVYVRSPYTAASLGDRLCNIILYYASGKTETMPAPVSPCTVFVAGLCRLMAAGSRAGQQPRDGGRMDLEQACRIGGSPVARGHHPADLLLLLR